MGNQPEQDPTKNKGWKRLPVVKLGLFWRRLGAISRSLRILIFVVTFGITGGVIFLLVNYALPSNTPCSKSTDFGHVAPGLTKACQYSSGIYELLQNNGQHMFTHGADAIKNSNQPSTAGAVSSGTTITAPPIMPACASDYYFQVIYGVAAGYTPNINDINNIKNAVEVSNGFINGQNVNIGHNLNVNLKVLCSGGQIAVTQINLPQSDPSFQDVVNDLQAQGYNAPNVKYWVYVTAQGGDYSTICGTTAGCAYGIGSMYYGASGDDVLSTSNPHDGNFPLYAVSFNSFSPFLWSHEATHTMGAVQTSAPNSNGTGHCTINYDIMCYGYTPSGTPTTCVNVAYDCVLNNYYNPVPAGGSYLATHWNIGSSINRFVSITQGGTAPGYEMAYNGGGSLWTSSSYGNNNWSLGMYPGTSPGITSLHSGGYEATFESNQSDLWTVGNGGNQDWHLGMYPGTSPSIAGLATGSYEAAFEANTGSLWTVGAAGNNNWSLGMYPGTNPSITALSNGGYEVAFEANTGSLWTVGTAGWKDWQLGMYPGSSPSITALPGGGYEVAFEANTGSLWTVGNSGAWSNWSLGMYPRTNPSITALANGGYEVAFEANTGSLWTVGNGGNVNWSLGMHPGTSPSITTSANGGYEATFESNQDELWTVGNGGNQDWHLSMQAGTNPSITRF